MHHREVIIARFGTWILSSRKLAGFRENALDGPNVVFPLVLGQVATAMRYVINGWLTAHWKGNVLFLPDTHSLLCTSSGTRQSIRQSSFKDLVRVGKSLLLDLVDGESLSLGERPC